jgi:hypothetical protein
MLSRRMGTRNDDDIFVAVDRTSENAEQLSGRSCRRAIGSRRTAGIPSRKREIASRRTQRSWPG